MKHWWHRYLRLPGELRALGVVGLNHRNAALVLPNNPRRLYERVDNKIFTKRLAIARGIAVPETFGIVRSPADVRKLGALLGGRDSFVIKPARGSGGKGVLVICGRDEEFFLKGSGARLTLGEIKDHLQNIIAGLFSLGGKRDSALVEARVEAARALTGISFQGAPDIRLVMLHGYPVMIEVNARPGLAIQLANGVGLRKRVGPVLRRLREHPGDEPADKIAFARKTFAAAAPSAL